VRGIFVYDGLLRCVGTKELSRKRPVVKRDASTASSESQGGAKSSAVQDRTELDSLTRQVGELSEQVQRFLSESAEATLRRAGDTATAMMSGVGVKGREAMEGMQEVKDNLAGAIDASVKNRPYTTLAVAFGLGFLFARLR
jgi:ElaB/YqjD/DUF883 family membrane-anchored ribosome-binding protein